MKAIATDGPAPIPPIPRRPRPPPFLPMIDSLALALGLIARGDAELFGIATLSLRVSLSASLVAAVMGLSLGAWLAVARFPGHRTLVWAVNTLLALPSVVVGLLDRKSVV